MKLEENLRHLKNILATYTATNDMDMPQDMVRTGDPEVDAHMDRSDARPSDDSESETPIPEESQDQEEEEAHERE